MERWSIGQICCRCPSLTRPVGMVSTFLYEVRQGDGSYYITYSIVILFGLFDNQHHLFLVVDSKRATQCVGAEVFDEGSGNSIAILDQQLFKLNGVLKCSTVRQYTCRIHQWIIASARRHGFARSPSADRIVLIKSKAQGIDAAMTGRTTCVLGVCSQLFVGWLTWDFGAYWAQSDRTFAGGEGGVLLNRVR